MRDNDERGGEYSLAAVSSTRWMSGSSRAKPGAVVALATAGAMEETSDSHPMSIVRPRGGAVCLPEV